MAQSRLVVLDNHLISLILRKDIHPDDRNKAETARKFLQYLDEREKIVLLPTPVITECLTPVDPHQRPEVLDKISRFQIADFDMQASIKCADMMYAITPDKSAYRAQLGINKSTLKFDYMIAAIAVVNGAECIYSYDGGLKTFCEGHIPVREIPEFPEQSSLPFE